MGFGFGNAIAAVKDPHIQACLQRLGAKASTLESTLSTLVRNNASTSSIEAGAGLTGGGTLNSASSISLAVGAGAGISVVADAVGLTTTGVTAAAYTNTSLTVDAYGRLTAASSGAAPASAANPTASVGLTAVNGSASTYMRSDGAPALDVTIAPTWSGAHTFSNAAGIALSASGGGIIQTSVANSLTNYGTLVRNSVGLTASRRMFQVDWHTGLAYQEAFGVWSQAGSAKGMRLAYDSTNHWTTTVNSSGNVTSTATGSYNLSAATTYQLSAGTNLTLLGNVLLLAASSVVFNDGAVISNSANTTGLKIGAAGDKLGFYSVTPVVRPSAFTQTYSTSSATCAALTSSTLTDSTGGTATTTVQALTDPTDTPITADALRDDLVANLIPELRNNFADIVAQVNALRVDIDNTKQNVTKIIDDGQSLGILQ